MGIVSSFFARLFAEDEVNDPVDIGQRKLSIELKIGEGSFGSLFVLEDRDTQQRYAIKVFKKGLLLKDQVQIARLEAEKEILRRLHHPFLSNLLACEQDAYRLFMIFELSLGGDLQMKRQYHKRLPERAVIQVAISVLMGLQYLHQQGLVHGDLKPANILVDVNGYCRICDFGLCRTPVAQGCYWGTVPYMSPEQVRLGAYTPAADMWSLGILLFEMFWGVMPWDLDDYYPTTELPPATMTEKEKLRFTIEHRIALVDRLQTPNVDDPKIPFSWGVHDLTWSETLADLIGQLTIADPAARLTSANAFSHKCFSHVDLEGFAAKTLRMSSFLQLRAEEYPFPLQLNFETEERVQPLVDAISIGDQRRFFDNWNWSLPVEPDHPNYFGSRDLTTTLYQSNLFLNTELNVPRELVEPELSSSASSSSSSSSSPSTSIPSGLPASPSMTSALPFSQSVPLQSDSLPVSSSPSIVSSSPPAAAVVPPVAVVLEDIDIE